MLRHLMIGVVSVVALMLSTAAIAQQGQFGTPAEAKAMLEKAVAAVKADKTKAPDFSDLSVRLVFMRLSRLPTMKVL